MKTQTLARLMAGVAALSVAAAGQAASAQARGAAAAAPAAPTVAGPIIPGVCIFSNERALQTSAVGRAVIARMQVLAQQVNTELNPEKTAIQAEDRTLAGQRATLTADVFNQRASALGARVRNLEQTAQIRGRELEATQNKALQRISTEMEPVLRAVYNQRNCGLMLDRNSVIAGNQQMDVTDAVVAGLNAKIATLTFERERISAPAAATPAPTRR